MSRTRTARCSSARSAMISTSPSWPASPCSTAFVTSSVSASASGVAYSLGSVPNLPVERVRARVRCRRDLGDELEHAVEHLVEVDVLRESLRERVVHDGDRRHAAHRLRERFARLFGVRAARLDAQQRRDGLQVVLDPVVDLADRRVLGDELLLLVAQFGHVAAQHDRADALAAVAERDRAQRDGDAARLDVGAPRRATGHDERAATRRTAASPGRMRVVTSMSDSPSSSSSKPMRLNAESALGLAKVVMPSTSRRMRPSEARGAPRRGAVGRRQVGEVARRDHPEQVVGAVVERDLLPRRRAGLAEVGVAGEHADRRAVARRCGLRTIGTARTRVGVSSNQSGEAESTMRPLWNASRTCVRHCGRTRSPTMSR